MYAISVTYIYSDVQLDILKFLIFFTAAWLAQLGERWSAEWEFAGSNPSRTNTQGLKITEKIVLPLKWRLDFLVFLDKGRKTVHVGPAVT